MSAAAAANPLGIGEDSTGAPVGHDPKNPKRDERVTRMGTASIPKLIVEFAVPSIIGMLVNGAYSVIDSAFLGQAMGDIGIETMTVANPVMIIFLALAMLVGVGGNALAALRLGEGKRVDAEISLGNTLFLCLVTAAVVAYCGLNPFILDNLLTLSSATDHVRPYAESFLRIVCCGFVFQCVGMGINNFIRTAGAPNRALMTMIIGAVSCVAFNFLFVIHFGWGVEGSAFATLCGQAISCATVLWYFIFTKGVPLRLHARFMKPRARIIGKILTLGLASFFVQAGASVVSFVLNHLLVVYGAIHPLGADLSLASIGVVNRVSMFTVLPIIGVAVAIQPLIGYNYGAKLISRVRKAFWWGSLGATLIGVLVWLLVQIFADPIVRVFGIADDSLVNFTSFALKVQLVMLPFIGFQIVGSNYFQATGQPLKSVILTLTRQIVFLVPLLFVLPLILPHMFEQFTSLDALYFATPVSDALSIFTVGIFMAFEMKRLKKLEAKQLEEKGRGVETPEEQARELEAAVRSASEPKA